MDDAERKNLKEFLDEFVELIDDVLSDEHAPGPGRARSGRGRHDRGRNPLTPTPCQAIGTGNSGAAPRTVTTKVAQRR
jgi:hypothetical protein